MKKIDVRLACCVLNTKLLLKELKELSSGEEIELIAENTESMKSAIRKFAEAESCKIIDVVDENSVALVTVQRVLKLDALIMAGGRGTRLKVNVEKPLLIFRGRSLIERLLGALRASKYIKSVTVVTSKNTEKTEAGMRERGVNTLRAPGSGYVEDMIYALKKLRLGKTLVISSDMPLISGEDVDYVVEEYFKKGKPAMAVFVPEKIFKKYKIKPTMVFDDVVPAGINIVDGNNLNGEESKLITEKIQFAGNLNSVEDLRKIESIIYKGGGRD